MKRILIEEDDAGALSISVAEQEPGQAPRGYERACDDAEDAATVAFLALAGRGAYDALLTRKQAETSQGEGGAA